MSLDKSLRKRGSLVRARNVLKRHERIAQMIEDDRWKDRADPYGLPKVRVFRVIAKKAKKEKKEEGAAATPAAAAAAPAAGGAKKK